MDETMVVEFVSAVHQVRSRIEDCTIDVARALMAPHKLYGAKLSKDGNQWCWLYGDNLHDGVAGFGDTPAKAATAFDREWGFFA